jgi:hypothetical protein
MAAHPQQRPARRARSASRSSSAGPPAIAAQRGQALQRQHPGSRPVLLQAFERRRDHPLQVGVRAAARYGGVGAAHHVEVRDLALGGHRPQRGDELGAGIAQRHVQGRGEPGAGLRPPGPAHGDHPHAAVLGDARQPACDVRRSRPALPGGAAGRAGRAHRAVAGGPAFGRQEGRTVEPQVRTRLAQQPGQLPALGQRGEAGEPGANPGNRTNPLRPRRRVSRSRPARAAARAPDRDRAGRARGARWTAPLRSPRPRAAPGDVRSTPARNDRPPRATPAPPRPGSPTGPGR